MGFSTDIGQLYAAAIFELARELQQVETVRDDLLSLAGVAADEKEFLAFSASPYFSRQTKDELLQKLFSAKLTGLTMEFLGVVNKHNRMSLLPQIAAEYEKLRDVHAGCFQIEAAFAKDMTGEQIAELKRRLEESLKGEVKLSVKVDSSIIGGVILRCCDVVVDNSVKRELKEAVIAITGRRKNQG